MSNPNPSKPSKPSKPLTLLLALPIFIIVVICIVLAALIHTAVMFAAALVLCITFVIRLLIACGHHIVYRATTRKPPRL